MTNRLASSQQPALSPEELDDEICNLDIEGALFPRSSARSRAASPAPSFASGNTDRTGGGTDAFSPAAYKNLHANATLWLSKIQGAYRERAAELREARGERDAQMEEAEEARLRVELFKTQLEDMARRATEHEEEMRRLVAELDAEKNARRRYEEQLNAAAAAASRANMEAEKRDASPSARPSSDEEELGDDGDADGASATRSTWRNSHGTIKSNLSVETSATDGDSSESVHSSVFSRSRSPTTIMTTNTAYEGEGADGGSSSSSSAPQKITPTPAPAPASSTPALSPAAMLAPPKPQSQPQPQLSAFQKLVRGIGGSDSPGGGSGPRSCRNCSGRDSSVAWDTVSLLRDENKGLKHRVSQLEVAVEGALDVVHGIGLR